MGPHSNDNQDVFTSTIYEREHPVVRVHPETGNGRCCSASSSAASWASRRATRAYLFDLFQQHVTRLENTVRWHWSPGDVAMWDNRASQHYAIDDYGDLPRKMHRITIAGDRAVSVTGETSRAIAGDSAAYNVLV